MALILRRIKIWRLDLLLVLPKLMCVVQGATPPASGTTIGKIAAGISDNLATRSALVALKERRKLILVPRETPVATPHLEAMAKLSSWGVVILPASPGFYKNPETIDDLIDFVVARILDQLDVEHEVGSRWTGKEVS